MAINLTTVKKTLQELTGMAVIDKQIKALEKRIAGLETGIQALGKKAWAVSKQVEAKKAKGKDKKSLAVLVEEVFVESGGGPLKVTEVRDILLKDKKVKTRAKNFYTVLTVSMNNSPRFKKTGPGEYALVQGKAAKPAQVPDTTKAPAKKKKAAVPEKADSKSKPVEKKASPAAKGKKKAVKKVTPKKPMAKNAPEKTEPADNSK